MYILSRNNIEKLENFIKNNKKRVETFCLDENSIKKAREILNSLNSGTLGLLSIILDFRYTLYKSEEGNMYIIKIDDSSGKPIPINYQLIES